MPKGLEGGIKFVNQHRLLLLIKKRGNLTVSSFNL